MKLNTIDFSLSLDDNGKHLIPFNFKFVIDEENANETFWGGNDFYIDPNILLHSCFDGITGFLFTCGCGTPSCGNIYNDCSLAHQTPYIVWMIPKKYNNFEDRSACSYDFFYFNKREYQKKLYMLCTEIASINNENQRHIDSHHNYIYSYETLKNTIENIISKYEKEIQREERRLTNKREFEQKRRQSEKQ